MPKVPLSRAAPETAAVPLILDVDTGIDDALALLYACASPEAELVACHLRVRERDGARTSSGTRGPSWSWRAAATWRWPSGARCRSSAPLEITPETHGPRGIGYAELPDPVRLPVSRAMPSQLIVDEARRRPGEITLVTLGPLTNLAIAVLMEPRLPNLLKRWIAMGGAFRVPGNTTPTTEWNIHCDPEAAQDLLGGVAGRRARRPGGAARAPAMGLDVTEQARILPADLATLAERRGAGRRPDSADRTRSSNSSTDALRWYFEFHARYDGFYGAFVHDPLVIACALDPSLVRAEASPRRWTWTPRVGPPTARPSQTGGGLWGRTAERGRRGGGRRGRVPAAARGARRHSCDGARGPPDGPYQPVMRVIRRG